MAWAPWVAHPSVARSLGLAEKADNAPRRPVPPSPPVAVALAGEQIPAAHGAHRHRLQIIGPAPDVAEGLGRTVPDHVFGEAEIEAVRNEVELLGRELDRYVS
jgi:hypothetical protein